MSSITLFRELLKTLPPKAQVFNILVVAVVLFACAGLHYSTLRTYTAPDLTKLVVVEGRVNGEGRLWEHNESMVRFGASYILQGKRQRQPVYVDLAAYEQSDLRVGTKVRLTVEVHGSKGVIRELATHEGRVLFNDYLHQQVIAWNNESVWQNIVLINLAALAPIFAALRVAWKHRRTLFH